MRQQTLADEGFERYRNPTRRDQFLAEMDQVIPWRDLCKVVKPFYPTPKGAGRPPVGLERMLRTSFSATLVQPVRSGGGRSPV